MLRKRLTAMFVPLFATAITGAAFAAPSASAQADTAEKGGKLGEAFTVLHAVTQWSIDLSKLADDNAQSELVKGYAREIGAGRRVDDVW